MINERKKKSWAASSWTMPPPVNPLTLLGIDINIDFSVSTTLTDFILEQSILVVLRDFHNIFHERRYSTSSGFQLPIHQIVDSVSTYAHL